ncbi:SIS domain-containing protein [Endozoicomonas sp. SM1973]|uniref:SIS domain-containing protein n=1 Tax=Spartinivicinus marinus TaxID=2994442 RepID=A0A853I070_9GAMM|nr:SIS domain-containing protein [Spartinivicinus marinus]MCX4026451.1 SIS domain-containing protein [Spartinivicinus marinus]NYZ66823.1 SIS domain-containing protein [Spartinivicinus marinus]
MQSHVLAALTEAKQALDNLLSNEAMIEQITKAAAALTATFKQGGHVYSCGNGGSMCDAMHFAEELSGRYRLNRKGLPAIAISDPSHLSCVSNDFGYEHVFARYVDSHARAGDTLLAISTSGTSKNIIAAAEVAKQKGVTVIGMTGKTNCALGDLADIHICTPGGQFADRVQELHIKVIHIFMELVERELFPENYQ